MYTDREIEEELQADGWYKTEQRLITYYVPGIPEDS
jgi:hypothetical protein